MNNSFYGNCEKPVKSCGYECPKLDSRECDEFKTKSDELYIKAHSVQEESRRLICEANAYNEEAKELERKSRELCAKANMVWNNARKAETEAMNLLDLASFYCHKAAECYKNLNMSCQYRPDCDMSQNCNMSCDCNVSCVCKPKHHC